MKPKQCKICPTVFEPRSPFQKVCSPMCAIKLLNQDKEEKARKAFRKETRERKEKLKSKSDWLREAQQAFNAYIRERDKNEVCISCQNTPKKRNAGHYKSVGSHPELRFSEFNCHLQCEHCNTYKSGNQVSYRQNLLRKVGCNIVEWLEGPHQQQHLDIEDIKEIKAWYKARIKEL